MGRHVTYQVERGYALDGQTPAFEAIQSVDGVIVWVGTAKEARRRVPSSTIRRLDGAYLVPGLVDTHLHLGLMGRGADAVDLSTAQSVDDLVSAVWARANSPWIEGVGWDDGQWSTPLDAAALHQRLPDIPILLTRRDHHAGWASRALLAHAGSTATEHDPEGGRIERDANGLPTGLLIDTALDPVRKALPTPDATQRRRWLERALSRCRAMGLTGVHEICTPRADMDALSTLARDGELPIRVDTFLYADDPDNAPLLERGPIPGQRLSVVGAKLFCDGALGSRGAWLSAPYADDPTTQGLKIVAGPQLTARVLAYAHVGFAVAIHGIGDAAVAEIAAAYTQARAAGIVTPLRLEHAQIVSPEALSVLGTAGVTCAVQPIHALDDASWYRDRLGPRLSAWAYRLRSLVDAGIPVVLGTDAPISGLDPMKSLRAAIDPARPRGGLEALTIEDAFRCHSVAAPFAAGKPHPGAFIGRRADFTLLDGDPFSGRDLGSIGVVGTLIDGALPHPAS